MSRKDRYLIGYPGPGECVYDARSVAPGSMDYLQPMTLHEARRVLAKLKGPASRKSMALWKLVPVPRQTPEISAAEERDNLALELSCKDAKILRLSDTMKGLRETCNKLRRQLDEVRAKLKGGPNGELPACPCEKRRK